MGVCVRFAACACACTFAIMQHNTSGVFGCVGKNGVHAGFGEETGGERNEKGVKQKYATSGRVKQGAGSSRTKSARAFPRASVCEAHIPIVSLR